jgi:hypothetical protein
VLLLVAARHIHPVSSRFETRKANTLINRTLTAATTTAGIETESTSTSSTTGSAAASTSGVEPEASACRFLSTLLIVVAETEASSATGSRILVTRPEIETSAGTSGIRRVEVASEAETTAAGARRRGERVLRSLLALLALLALLPLLLLSHLLLSVQFLYLALLPFLLLTLLLSLLLVDKRALVIAELRPPVFKV